MHARLRWILICIHLWSSFSVQIWYIIHKHYVLYVYIHIFLHSTVPVPFAGGVAEYLCLCIQTLPWVALLIGSRATCLVSIPTSGHDVGMAKSHHMVGPIEWKSLAPGVGHDATKLAWQATAWTQYLGHWSGLVSCMCRIVEWHLKHCSLTEHFQT